VALLQVVLHALYSARPTLTTFNHRPTLTQAAVQADAVLLIGDKVVSSAPPGSDFPYQLDLGDAWRRITGLPFVFAAWMARKGTDLEGLPYMLRQRRETNRGRIRDIVDSHATGRGWTRELAELYLGTLLSFDLGERELKAMSLFWERCHELGLIDEIRPLELYDVSG
jgi:chorismate dehydratase